MEEGISSYQDVVSVLLRLLLCDLIELEREAIFEAFLRMEFGVLFVGLGIAVIETGGFIHAAELYAWSIESGARF